MGPTLQRQWRLRNSRIDSPSQGRKLDEIALHQAHMYVAVAYLSDHKTWRNLRCQNFQVPSAVLMRMLY